MKNNFKKKCGYINKKRIQVFVLCTLLGIVFYGRNMEVKASGNIPVPEEYTAGMDEDLKAYIDQNIPKDVVWIDSDTKSNFIQTSSTKDNQKLDLKDEVKGTIYTFSSGENGEKVYYTVLDFYFTEKISTSKEDLLELHTNDFLRPVSPGKGELLVRDKVDEEWKVKKDVSVIINLSFASVYGEEMNNNQNFSRVIMSFKSYGNPDSAETLPGYIIDYTHHKESFIPFITISAVIIFLMIFLGYLFYNHYKSNKKSYDE